jgi:hypothetical protein
MTPRALNHHARSLVLPVVVAVFVAGCGLTSGAGAASDPAAATAAASPTAAIAGTPVLTVAIRSKATRDGPAAWITFRTSRRLSNPRLIVGRVAGKSGRTYRATPGSTCLRSTIVTDSGRINMTPGRHYTVRFYARAGIGRKRPKTLVATRSLIAHGKRTTFRTDPPLCRS